MPGPFGFTNAFSSGEVDDNAYDRTDLQQVAKGCALGQNLLIQIAGPLAKRPGFWLVGSASATRPTTPALVAFRKSWADSCTLEFGHLVCHVWNVDGTPLHRHRDRPAASVRDADSPPPSCRCCAGSRCRT